MRDEDTGRIGSLENPQGNGQARPRAIQRYKCGPGTTELEAQRVFEGELRHHQRSGFTPTARPESTPSQPPSQRGDPHFGPAITPHTNYSVPRTPETSRSTGKDLQRAGQDQAPTRSKMDIHELHAELLAKKNKRPSEVSTDRATYAGQAVTTNRIRQPSAHMAWQPHVATNKTRHGTHWSRSTCQAPPSTPRYIAPYIAPSPSKKSHQPFNPGYSRTTSARECYYEETNHQFFAHPANIQVSEASSDAGFMRPTVSADSRLRSKGLVAIKRLGNSEACEQ